jgi:hypothetical protein
MTMKEWLIEFRADVRTPMGALCWGLLAVWVVGANIVIFALVAVPTWASSHLQGLVHVVAIAFFASLVLGFIRLLFLDERPGRV